MQTNSGNTKIPMHNLSLATIPIDSANTSNIQSNTQTSTELDSTVTTPLSSISIASETPYTEGRVPQIQAIGAGQMTTTSESGRINSEGTQKSQNFAIVDHPVSYQTGFNNTFSTDAIGDALPIGQNNPQRCKYGLYAEQISGSAFTVSRSHNLRTWAYRLLPRASDAIRDYQATSYPSWQSKDSESVTTPNPLRWKPPYDLLNSLRGDANFIESIFTVATNDVGSVHWYNANKDMTHQYFYNSDADMIILPQEGDLQLKTEMGIINIKPKEVAVIPRGIIFQATPLECNAKGYICENMKAPLVLPDRGPIGANGLANEADFEYPEAWYEDKSFNLDEPIENGGAELVHKYKNDFFSKPIDHSPLDVVAWKGNYSPFKYDLTKFNTMNTVSFDHPDPSIFTVMTSPSESAGTANIDFVLFPPRWMVAENSFRPPYFHRNVMGELMGLIEGVYDAKEEGFAPGAVSIHNPTTPHGPEASVVEKASSAELKPVKQENTYAFMFESRQAWNPTQQAMDLSTRDSDYGQCWSNFTKASIPNNSD